MNIELPNIKNGYCETDFSVIKFTNNPNEFLNGLTSNTARAEETVFPDINGKIIVHAWQLTGDNVVHIVIRNEFKERLFTHLKKYQLISPVKIEVLESTVYFVRQNDFQHTNKISLPGGYLVWDTVESLFTNLEKLNTEWFTRIRLVYDLPLQGIDFEHQMLLELDRPQSLSYEKGCYLGQEIIARVTSKGRPAKTLKRILSVQNPQIEMGFDVRSSMHFTDQNIWISFVWVKKDPVLPGDWRVLEQGGIDFP